jgi:multiple sugar transport system ATP-binding protein
VAGFIGSPAMNFFPVTIRKDGTKLIADSGEFKVEIPENRKNLYMDMADREVIFGIRPEDIHNPDYVPSGIFAQTVEARVDVTELMGNEIFLYLVSGTNEFVARVDPRTRFAMGDKVKLTFNMDNFHIFDPALDKENPAAVR